MVAEQMDSEKGGPRDLPTEPGGHTFPSVYERLVLADYVDEESTDVVKFEAVDPDERVKVIEASICLCPDVAYPNERAACVGWHLACHEELGPIGVSVAVARCWCTGQHRKPSATGRT